MKDKNNKERAQNQNASDSQAKSVRGKTLLAFAVRFGFVVLVIIASRMFLGNITRARGRADIAISFSMMLLIILLVERFAPRILREILLVLMGASLLFFHLLNGLYYRFFNCPIPFDVFRQWRDVFVVGPDGLGLMSGLELIVAVILPVLLLVWILCKPLKSKSFVVIVILLAISIIGWTHRLNRPINRSVSSRAALPDFIHRFAFYRFKLGLGRQRYLDIIGNISTDFPRALAGYRSVPDKGIMVEPVEALETNDPAKYNIILILMESVRTYECGFLGAEPSFTPELDKLAKNARVYTNFYANGSQTVRAEIGLLCSIYPNPVGVPTYLVNPNLKVISLPEILGETGYDTLWFSAYTADFDNKRNFLTRHGVKKLFDRDVLPKPQRPVIGWGMNDVEMFQNVWKIIEDQDEPFFAEITTLSSHGGRWEYPTDRSAPKIKDSARYKSYARGIYYTDSAVAKFIRKVQNSRLALNTIIIITGDHGVWVFPSEITDPLQKQEIYFRTPLCVWGPPELVQPGIDHTLGSHIDVAPTLLDMLNIHRRNTFLGQSLVNTKIPHQQRYVLAYLGSIPYFRAGDVASLLSHQFNEEIDFNGSGHVATPDSYGQTPLNFATVGSDLLRGSYIIKPFDDQEKVKALSKRVDDITFLTAYGIYFNALQGVR
ncbi:MAG: LTA synthase family protein [Planctomycetota bacterium]